MVTILWILTTIFAVAGNTVINSNKLCNCYLLTYILTDHLWFNKSVCNSTFMLKICVDRL